MNHASGLAAGLQHDWQNSAKTITFCKWKDVIGGVTEMELTALLKQRGEQARLFPVLADNSREGRAASIFLACVQTVPSFADAILSPLGRGIGTRSKITCLTEVLFKSHPDKRPDGIITVQTGSSTWSALLEFKVGGKLEVGQVEDYLKIANQNSLDALITISNDLVSYPTVCPVKIDGRLTRSTKLFHLSWMHIFTQAELLLSEDRFQTRDHRYLISEFARFLVHKSTGIRGFEAMPEAWQDIVRCIRSRASLSKRDEKVIDVVDGWLQEERELELVLSRKTSTRCQVKRPRGADKSLDMLRSRHINQLVKAGQLTTAIEIPNAVSPIDVCADIASRSILFSMTARAPGDRKRATASINWLLRQLPSDLSIDPFLRVHWPGRTKSTQKPLSEARRKPEILLPGAKVGIPVRFEIVMLHELKSKFESRKGFIRALEDGIREFYEAIGQHLPSWTPPPPKGRETSAVEEIVEKASFDDERPDAFNPFLE